MKILKGIVFFISLFLVLCGTIASAQELTLTAGPEGADIARISADLAVILNEEGLTVTETPSDGDIESILSLASGSADLAVVDSLSAYEASLGIGRFSEKRKNGPLALAVVGMSTEHFLLVKSSDPLQDITELAGKILYIGPEGDPGLYAARTIISSSGIDSFFEVGGEWDYPTAAELLIDGTYDGAIFSGLTPLSPVAHISAVMGGHLVFLEVSDDILSRLRSQWPIWFPYVVPENTYPPNDKPYKTIARPILLVAAKSLDKNTVKKLLTRLFDKTRQYPSALPSPITESMSFTYCPIKFHPGAADYFREKGY